MKNVIVACLLMVVAAAAGAQQGPPVVPAPAEMDLLTRLAGHWEGGGWFRDRDGQSEFRQTEKVEVAINGHAIVVEGRGVDAASSDLVHDALAVMTWDDADGTYVVHAWKADGTYVKASGRAEDESFIWWFDVSSGTVRYTIDLSKPGHWTEIGEYSADGEHWMQFLELKLTRSGDPV